MHPHAYKKVPTAEKPEQRYSPVEYVKKLGDLWVAATPTACAGATALALRDQTPDEWEAYIMTQLEKGRHPRVQEDYP